MRNGTLKPPIIILDAVIVIKLFKYNLWDSFVENYQVYLPAIVAHKESKFYKTLSGEKVPIDLSSYINDGKCHILSADADLLTLFSENFDLSFRKSINEGEKEALALLETEKILEKALFCTADRPAVHALCLMRLSSRGISLEELLLKVSLSIKKIEAHLTKEAFNNWLKEGKVKSLTGEGLSEKSKYRINIK